jgi:ribosomal protein S18 acetylase RimI-like enzyme
MITIDYALQPDFKTLQPLDYHISAAMLVEKIIRREIFVAKIDNELVAWLRFGYFWDNIPFMNMLFVLESHRGKGIGAQLVLHWEHAMQNQGFDQVFTSTLSNESAQHFYRKLGYIDCGSLSLPGEAPEIILRKPLGESS